MVVGGTLKSLKLEKPYLYSFGNDNFKFQHQCFEIFKIRMRTHSVRQIRPYCNINAKIKFSPDWWGSGFYNSLPIFLLCGRSLIRTLNVEIVSPFIALSCSFLIVLVSNSSPHTQPHVPPHPQPRGLGGWGIWGICEVYITQPQLIRVRRKICIRVFFC